MTKRQYLSTLDSCLAGKLPEPELQDLLNYYDEYFEEAGIEHEEATAAALGDPRTLAAQILAEQMISEATEPAAAPPPKNQSRTAWVIAAVVLLLLVVFSSIYALVQRLNGPKAPSELLSLTEDHTAVVETIDDSHERYTLKTIEALTVELTWGDIVVEYGKDFTIDLNWDRSEDELRCEFVSGVITVQPRFHNNSSSIGVTPPEVRVTLPANEKPRDLKLSTGAGMIRLSNINAGTIALNTNSGNVDLYRCDADSLTATIALGNLEADCVNADLLVASLSAGNASMRQCDIDSTALTVQMGNVDLNGCSPLTNHKELTLDTFMGSVTIHGKDRGSSFTYAAGSGDRTLEVHCSMGNITLEPVE